MVFNLGYQILTIIYATSMLYYHWKSNCYSSNKIISAEQIVPNVIVVFSKTWLNL